LNPTFAAMTQHVLTRSEASVLAILGDRRRMDHDALRFASALPARRLNDIAERLQAEGIVRASGTSYQLTRHGRDVLAASKRPFSPVIIVSDEAGERAATHTPEEVSRRLDDLLDQLEHASAEEASPLQAAE
jgi:predicted transcriptional regulator